jgi:hypothetical protein
MEGSFAMKEADILRPRRPNPQTKPAGQTQASPSTQAPIPRSGFVLRPIVLKKSPCELGEKLIQFF